MNTTKQQLPAHMSSEQYHKFFDSCFDEESGYHNNDALASLQEMIDLSLAIEKISEEMDELEHADVTLDIEDWDHEFVCKSGDLYFQKSKDKFYVVKTQFRSELIAIGIMNQYEVFTLLRAQRRLEQTR